MARLELSLLGPMQVALDGLPVTDFGTDKTRALLAYVFVAGTHPHRRDTLTGLLWPDQPEEAARTSLRQAIYKLRRVLGEQEQTGAPRFLLVDPQTVQLDPGADYRLDVVEFTELVAACKAHRHRKPEHCASCHTRLLRAAELYRGDFFQTFFLEDSQLFDEWLVLKREGLRRNVLGVFASLAKRYEARGEYEQALHYAYRQLDLEPWREEVHRRVMGLLVLTGQRAAALAQYEACRERLNEELGVDPDAETTALYARLRAGESPDGPSAQHHPEATGPAARHNLPRSLTPFIGREEELARIVEQLDSTHYCLITLVGPGGVGKTRLALQAAREQIGAFNDGVYWVPLAPVSSPELVASGIAQATGLHFEGAQDPVRAVREPPLLVSYLRDKEMLLVLDNFEQLVGTHGDPRRRRVSDRTSRSPVGAVREPPVQGGATDLLMSILKGAPRVSMLVTSRERLGLQAEFLLDVSGLSFPGDDDGRWTMDDGFNRALSSPPSSIVHRPSSLAGPGEGLESYGAVRLFVERAQQAHSGFTLSRDTAKGVVEICQLVAGLPLGIVLAAAWARHFTPARIAASIRANLDFLTSSSRDASPQHSSLRAVFDHSWDLLSDEEKSVFRGLSVFRGGWDEEAAEKVAGASLHSLLSLVGKSLLRQDASGRFGTHEVLRQYATEKLDEDRQARSEIRQRHATYYLELAELAEVELRGDEQGEWLEQLEREHDNLRAALHWAHEGLGVRGEGLGANSEALTAPRLRSYPSPLTPVEIGLRLGGALWRFWYMRGYLSEGRDQLAALLALARGQGSGVRGQGLPASLTPDPRPPPAGAHTPASEASLAKVLNGAGVLASVQGDHNGARALYEESLALSRELGDKQGIASSLNSLGIGAQQQGNYDDAHTLYEESLALRRELADSWGIAASLNNLGLVAHQQGNYDAARSLHQESLALRRELGDTMGIAGSLNNLGLVAQEQGDYDAARALYQESLTLRRKLGDQAGMAELFSYLGFVAQKQGEYNAARDLYEQGLTLSRELGYTWSIAFLLNNLGLVAQEEGDYDGAGALHKQSLALRKELGETIRIAGSLACLGGVAIGKASQRAEGSRQKAEGSDGGLPTAYRILPTELERAVRLFGVVEKLLEGTSAVLSVDDHQLYERDLAVVRAMLDKEAFEKAWAQGRAMSLEQAITYALE